MRCISRLPYSVSSCSGNGYVCRVPDIGCVCHSGWSSIGDFSVVSSGPQCLINYRAIRIMGYLCIFFPFICSILIIRHYVHLAMRNNSWCVISREHKTLFPFCFLIMSIAGSIYGLLKVSYMNGQQPLVGRDISISLIFFVFTNLGWTGVNIYLNLLINFLKGYSLLLMSERKERILRRLNVLGFYSWFVLPFALMFSILPVIADGFPSQANEICMACLIGLAVVAFLYGFILSNCLSCLIRELQGYVDSIEASLSRDIKVVLRRLNLAYFVVLGSCFTIATLLLVFGSYSFLFHLTTYFMLLTCTVVPPVTIYMVLTVSRISQYDDKQIVPTNSDEKLDDTPTRFYIVP